MTSRIQKTQTQKQALLSPLPISKKRLWAFRLIALIGLPLILFGCLELGLRLGGFGYSTEIATKQKVNGRELYCYNTKLGWRFFPKRLARDLAGFAFDITKSPGTYRIFVLGESAAQGVPDEHYNFGRFLEIMLEHEYPRTNFEVINVAMTAINSHGVYQIAKSCGRFGPDLMIVYMGNNEVVGPYGAGTIFAPFSPSLAMIRANAAITCTKTGQLLQSLLYAVGSGESIPASWGGMEMFLDKQVRPEADALNVVYRHFEQNLRDICHVAIQAGAKVLISNVGCNLKDSAPFASLHRDGLTDAEKRAWEEHYRDGMAHETANEPEAAAVSYLAAEQIDATFADLQFRLGRCFWNLGEHQTANERYGKAREYDTLRFRADTKINRLIQSVSEGREPEGVYFVDAVKALEANSPHQTPGSELFYEHVHYRFEGNYILAQTLFAQIIKMLPETITQHKEGLPVLTLADCEERLVYTAFEKYLRASFVLEDLISKPPFTNQSYHAESAAALENEVKRFEQDIPPSLEKTRALYSEQINRHPQDWRLRWKRAVFAAQDGTNLGYVAAEFKKVLQYLPYDKAYRGLLPILILQNKLDEAEDYAKEYLSIKPASPEAWFFLGDIFRKKGNFRRAVKFYSKGLDLQPDLSGLVYEYLAEMYEKSGHPEKAVNALYRAIDDLPKEKTAMIHIHLGLLLGAQNRAPEAVRILRTAIADFPPEQIKQETNVFALLMRLDQIPLAIELYRRVLTVQPDSLVILNNLAWIEATCDDEKIRNPKEAVELAEKACKLTQYRSARALDTLAAAYAGSGDFEKAVATAKQAVTTANETGQIDQAAKIKNKLRLYEKGLPYREKINP
jgi:tetratricopeptide (TPR) repeat protein